ncbi:unnamed protein product [Discosporangium mesarthrocarpum]
MAIEVNSAPYGGHVSATPRSGTSGVDRFTLECREWTDASDNLPLYFGFSYMHGKEGNGVSRHLSATETESTAWGGTLPAGKGASNFTISIIGHVTDSLGATISSYLDEEREVVTVQVGLGYSAGDSTTVVLNNMLTELSSRMDQESNTIDPGENLEAVVVFSATLSDYMNSSAGLEDGGTDGEVYEEFIGTMISSIDEDLASLVYTTETAETVTETLVVLGENPDLLSSHAQEMMLGAVKGVLLAADASKQTINTYISSLVVEVLDSIVAASSIANSSSTPENISTRWNVE